MAKLCSNTKTLLKSVHSFGLLLYSRTDYKRRAPETQTDIILESNVFGLRGSLNGNFHENSIHVFSMRTTYI